MGELIPPRIDREEVEECVQYLYHLEDEERSVDPESAAIYRSGRVVLERVLEGEGDAG